MLVTGIELYNLQGHYRRHRATCVLPWRLRFHFIQTLKNNQYCTRTMKIQTISFLSDPFEGDINYGTTKGATFFALATKDRVKDDLLNISQLNVSDIMVTFRHDFNTFCWEKLINMVRNNKG